MANQVIVYKYTGSVQTVELPSGEYILECWGAGNVRNMANARGGYAKGKINLIDPLTTFYIYVGGIGPNPTTGMIQGEYGGWNGGGGNPVRNDGQATSFTRDSGTGSGCTDICTVMSPVTQNVSTWRWERTSTSYLSRIIVGGGSGGGISSNATQPGGVVNVRAGSQTAGGTSVSPPGAMAASAFGLGATPAWYSDDRGPGGAGWYGGGSGGDADGGGGSNYVLTTGSVRPGGYLFPAGHPYEMTETQTIVGNLSMPDPYGPGNMTGGPQGNGVCRITRLNVPPSTGGLHIFVMGA